MGVRAGQQLSDWEGLMWRLEQDPFLSSNIANVTLFDRPLRFESLRRRLEWAVIGIPRLRQRIRTMPFNLGLPNWVDAVDFDLDRHLRRVTLPAPGDDRALFDLAAELAAAPFDPDHPLWELVVVDGLSEGRAAMIQKLHHTVADGEGALAMALSFFDFERHVADQPPPQPEEIPELVPPPMPSAFELIGELALRSAEIPRALVRQAQASITDPSRLTGATTKVSETVKAMFGQLVEAGPAYSPLWTARSGGRRLHGLSVPLGPVRAASSALGGTLNTAFLTVAATAAGAYHRELGAPAETLRASMAISTRRSGDESNAFTLARFSVPVGEMALPERFSRIGEITAHARQMATVASLDQIARVAQTLPTPVVNYLVRQQASSVDFATSNVRSSPVTFFVAGAAALHNYAIGPLAGVAFNLTLQSYVDQLDIGLHIDTAAIADPEMLCVELRRAFDELMSFAPE